jgi:hypothetical protein
MIKDTRRLYQRLLEANVPMGTHCSDLYFSNSVAAREIVRQSLSDGVLLRKPVMFWNKLNKEIWFEAPFEYAPFWDRSVPIHAKPATQ